MKTYQVKVPIAGHAHVEVEASSEEDAIDRALQREIGLDQIVKWHALRQFNEANVCYCPLPWEAEARLIHDGQA